MAGFPDSNPLRTVKEGGLEMTFSHRALHPRQHPRALPPSRPGPSPRPCPVRDPRDLDRREEGRDVWLRTADSLHLLLKSNTGSMGARH